MPKHNDVCRWNYKDTDGLFEPYWCKSRIAIYDEDLQRWFDTFWGSVSERFSFGDDNIKFEKHILGNLNDYKPCKIYDFDYYDEKDLLNLSHSNKSGLYYLRIGAVKSVDKIKAVLQVNLEKAEAKKQSLEYEIKRIKEKLQDVTPNTWI